MLQLAEEAGDGGGTQAQPLPVLRDDLEIVPGAPLANGAPAWVVFDPVANRYFEIGQELFDMLTVWDAGTADRLIGAVGDRYGREIEPGDVEEAIRFLISSALVRDIPDNDYRGMAAKAADSEKSAFATLMHSYLFFKIPLLRPDRFLQATWPVVRLLFTRTAVLLYAGAGLLGLYLVSRQWEHFATTFQFMLSWKGMALYGLSLVFVKSIHELGHAFMAVRYGLRVPTIGVAFMVLMPVLYTDTSGAWRLRSRKQRLMIDGAGIFTELSLACIATLVWCFLPDGGVRLCVFAVATTSWITSLLVNLNPLMRFDGYYILSDAIGFQNMQTRGFEMARWRMRELLFGLGEAPPEPMSSRMRWLVVLHAWATWVYRFFLFVGIAVLVYAFFIKLVGILLFAVEIVWFILLPVGREIARWWERKDAIMLSRRTYASFAVLVALGGLAVVPWSTSIAIPSVMGAGEEQRLYVPFPARLAALSMTDGQRVAAGDVLARLEAPKLDRDLAQVRTRARLLEARIDRAGSDLDDRAMRTVLLNELRSVREEIDGLSRTRRRLVLRAPFDGVVTDLDRELRPGLWLDAKAPLGLLRSETAPGVRGYVAETDIMRFASGASATFVPENPDLPRIDLTVAEVAFAGTEQLNEPYLALPYGGSIATGEGERQKLTPLHANYGVRLHPVGTDVAAPQRAERGVAIIQGEPKSFYARAKQQVLKVLVRELGV